MAGIFLLGYIAAGAIVAVPIAARVMGMSTLEFLTRGLDGDY